MQTCKSSTSTVVTYDSHSVVWIPRDPTSAPALALECERKLPRIGLGYSCLQVRKCVYLSLCAHSQRREPKSGSCSAATYRSNVLHADLTSSVLTSSPPCPLSLSCCRPRRFDWRPSRYYTSPPRSCCSASFGRPRKSRGPRWSCRRRRRRRESCGVLGRAVRV